MALAIRNSDHLASGIISAEMNALIESINNPVTSIFFIVGLF
jgi:hypothetical protein